MVKFARCCNPLPGDEIVGFITRGFGVSIHKRDCINVVNSINDAEQKERWVRAEWAENVRIRYLNRHWKFMRLTEAIYWRMSASPSLICAFRSIP